MAGADHLQFPAFRLGLSARIPQRVADRSGRAAPLRRFLHGRVDRGSERSRLSDGHGSTFPAPMSTSTASPTSSIPGCSQGRLPSFANTRSMRVAGGLGTIPRVVGDGQEIYRERLSVDDGLARIEALYKPYHRALRRLINKAHQAFGTVILVDCHSMPSVGVSRDEPRRPDMVIGDRYGTSCAALLPDMVEETMSRARLFGRPQQALCRRLHHRALRQSGMRTAHHPDRAQPGDLHGRAAARTQREVRAGDRGFRRAGRRAGRGSARRSRPVPGRGGVDSTHPSFRGARSATRNLDRWQLHSGFALRMPRNDGCASKRKKGRLNEQAAQV